MIAQKLDAFGKGFVWYFGYGKDGKLALLKASRS